MKSKENIISEFISTLETTELKLKVLTPIESEKHPSPGKWSPKEILGHLIDSACNNHRRFVLAQFTDELKFPGYEQDGWVTIQKFNQEPWQNLIQL